MSSIYNKFKKTKDRYWFDVQTQSVQTKKQVESELMEFFETFRKEDGTLEQACVIILSGKVRKSIIVAALAKIQEMETDEKHN